MLPIRAVCSRPLTSRGRPWLWNVNTTLTQQHRAASDRVIDRGRLNVTTPVAQELEDTRLWKSADTAGGTAKRKRQPPKVTGDRTRVNIVSEKLCDDVLSYVGKSLQRHKGCDLIDVYPGAGLWSRKLHEFLEPRSHILMEPDSAFYAPFLQPLLDKPGATLVSKSGIVWKDLNAILTPEYLPQQKVIDRNSGEAPERNDTLLVTCNLTFHPRKRFMRFDSVASLVLHQFIDSIRSSTLFQKYGQVRLLIWTRREDRTSLVPRCMQKKKRAAIVSELCCEWVHELVGYEGRDPGVFTRDSLIDRASALATLQRMNAENISAPAGRQSEALKLAMEDAMSPQEVLPGTRPPVLDRAYHDVLDSLKEADSIDSLAYGTEEYKTMKKYTWRLNSDVRRGELIHSIMQELDSATARRRRLQEGKTDDEEELRRSEQAISDTITRLKHSTASEFVTVKDNLHFWRQEEPILHWDRRAVDPLIASADEFYPNVESVLLDIQPRPVHPLLRQTGPTNANKAGDSFDMIAASLWGQPGQPVAKVLDSVWPGAADYIIPRCHSFRDSLRGGVNVETPHAQLTTRMMNARQWEDLIEKWMQWPFRPEFHELVARTQDDEPEEGSSVADGVPE